MSDINNQLALVPESRVKLKALDKAKMLRGAELKILPFINRKQTGINIITFLQSLCSLPFWLMTSHSSLQTTHSGQGDGWLKPSILSTHIPTGMSGLREYMQMTQIREHTFLMVIEVDPNDLNTIFTHFKECIQLSADRFAIVTFALLIWLKAVDIIKQENMSVIARLESYLGSMGNTMQYSGLLEVYLLISSGSTTANHILDGRCFYKGIRAHLFNDKGSFSPSRI